MHSLVRAGRARGAVHVPRLCMPVRERGVPRGMSSPQGDVDCPVCDRTGLVEDEDIIYVDFGWICRKCIAQGEEIRKLQEADKA